MLKIGLTGGIGTGKSTVASIFQSLGIPLLNADAISKQIIHTSPQVRQDIIDAFGAEAFTPEGHYNTTYIASIVFNDADQLNTLNQIIHPHVKNYTEQWWALQMERHAPYALKEAAILFESNSHHDLDYVIGVDAPLELRIKRTMLRDHSSRNIILQKMSRQMDQTEKMNRCDFIIINDEQQSLIEQVISIHQKIIQLSQI